MPWLVSRTASAQAPGEATGGQAIRLDSHFLADLGKAAEEGDPIAWGDLPVDRDAAYALVASQIAETFAGYREKDIAQDAQFAIALGTIVRLTVENFLLNQRLMRTDLAARFARLPGLRDDR